jgi:double-stranded uracil-DNA glycosylase
VSEPVADVGFAPIATPAARVLILGSLPGGESLKRGEYYASRSNAFWRVMCVLLGAAPDLPYELRCRCLAEAGIALWDVCHSAMRPGSLDASIDHLSVVRNDFAAFFAAHPHIQAISFNGNKAADLYRRKVLAGLPPAFAWVQRVTVPSTSSAYARMRFDEKVSRWRSSLAPWIALTNPIVRATS